MKTQKTITPAEAAALLIRYQTARDLLKVLTNCNSTECYKRALVLAFMLDKDSVGGTQRELARRLGITEGRASQMLKVMRRHLAK